MKLEQKVIIGLVMTSLMTSIFLAIKLPVIIMGMVIMIAGLVLTYYVGLNHRNLEDLGQGKILLKYYRKLHNSKDLNELAKQLNSFAAKLYGEIDSFLWIKNAASPLPDMAGNEYEEIARQIDMTGKRMMLDNNSGSENKGAIIGFPLIYRKKLVGIFYLLLKESAKDMEHRQMNLMESIMAEASIEINRIFAAEEREADTNRLIQFLVKNIEGYSSNFTGHGQRVQAVCKLIGKGLALTLDEYRDLELAALLHDIGRLSMERVLSQGEDQTVEPTDHATIGALLLAHYKDNTERDLDGVIDGIKYHHERYNGSGYPQGLKGNDIPFLARIIAVADIYDAMTRLNPEPERLTHDKALQVIKRSSGTLLDPLVIVAFEEVQDAVGSMYEEEFPIA